MASKKKSHSTRRNDGIPLPAKLSRPQTHGTVERVRLFALLDAQGSPGITWIHAPAGAGKTILAASWIAARSRPCLWYRLDAGDADPATLFGYLSVAGRHSAESKTVQFPVLSPQLAPDIGVFARRFFEQLCAVCGKSFTIVFDNCHEVPLEAPLHTIILPALLESLPTGGSILALSRERFPTSLMRWTADPGFHLLNWEDLSFTDEEAREFAQGAAPSVTDASIATWNRRAGGWIMGLKLLLQAAPLGLGLARADDRAMFGRLFEYLALEVLERTTPVTRELLLGCALLDDFDSEIVSVLLDQPRAREILEDLCAAGWFIERRILPGGISYRFHPLFREFLREHLARTLPAYELDTRRVRAARLLETKGYPEAATMLALESGDHELSTRLILQQAPALVSQGRFATLNSWVRVLPETLREADGWLLYWLGVTTSGRDANVARALLERAYRRFSDLGEVAGRWLAAACLIQSDIVSHDARREAWIKEFEALRTQNSGLLPPAIEAQLLMLLQGMVSHWPEHPLSRHLVERARIIGPTLPDAESRIAAGTFVVGFLQWQGDELGAHHLVDQLQAIRPPASAPSFATMYFDSWRGIVLWAAGEHGQARTVLSSGLQLCRQSGFINLEWPYLLQLAMTAMSAGDFAGAGTTLDECLRLAGSPGIVRVFLITRAMQLGLAGQREAAAAVARDQLALGEVGVSPSQWAYCRCILSVALLEAGALDEAASCATKALEFAAHLPSDRWTFDAFMMLAGVELERGHEAAVLERLEAALAIAAVRDFKNGMSLWQPRRVARLLALALHHEIRPEYVVQLIKRRGLQAPRDAAVDPRWPVALRVQSLGGFAVRLHGEAPLSLGGLPRKPLEVLKALIGLGPGGVSLGSLGAQLWPELDGDGAHNACQVAIHRLRKILGNESLLAVSHGAALLDSDSAWIDVWAFRELTTKVRSGQARGTRPVAETESLARQLIALYPGHFLPAEERSWAITVRERMRSRFVRAATDLSLELERAGAFVTAIELNRHAIELDPLVEEFHRGLLRGLLALQQKTAAIEAFRRCRELLARNLQAEPSPETCQLYARARQLHTPAAPVTER